MFSTSHGIILFLTAFSSIPQSWNTPLFVNEFVHVKLHVPVGAIPHQDLFYSTGLGTAVVTHHSVIHHHHKLRRPLRLKPVLRLANYSEVEGILQDTTRLKAADSTAVADVAIQRVKPIYEEQEDTPYAYDANHYLGGSSLYGSNDPTDKSFSEVYQLPLYFDGEEAESSDENNHDVVYQSYKLNLEDVKGETAPSGTVEKEIQEEESKKGDTAANEVDFGGKDSEGVVIVDKSKKEREELPTYRPNHNTEIPRSSNNLKTPKRSKNHRYVNVVRYKNHRYFKGRNYGKGSLPKPEENNRQYEAVLPISTRDSSK